MEEEELRRTQSDDIKVFEGFHFCTHHLYPILFEKWDVEPLRCKSGPGATIFLENRVRVKNREFTLN